MKTYDRVWKLWAKQGWCKNMLAQTKAGKRVSVKSEKAYAFCFAGAVERVYPSENEYGRPVRSMIFAKLNGAAMALGFKGITYLNDSKGMRKKMVIELAKKLDV